MFYLTFQRINIKIFLRKKMKNYVLKYGKGIVEIEGKTNYDVSFKLGRLLKWGYKQSEKNLKEKN